jgi:membrane protease YdiL (CAAX protease family)
MLNNIKKIIEKIYFILIMFVFVAPYFYDYWWKFIPSTLIIILFTKYCKGEWRKYLGTTIEKQNILILFFKFIFFICLVNLFLSYIIKNNELTTYQYPLYWYVTIFFQVLNEEIVFRGLILKSFFEKTNKKIIPIILAAAVFPLMHFLYYYYAEKVILGLSVIIILFLFAIICNLLYSILNHIWYGCVLHLALNLPIFTKDYYLNGIKINEGELFNIFGNSFVLTLFLTVSLFIIYRFNAIHKTD